MIVKLISQTKQPKVVIYIYFVNIDFKNCDRERSGSVVECLTRDRRAAGSSLTGVTALCA